MAEYINMQQDEYDEIQTKLAALHEEILTGEREIRRDIHLLIENGGGMYVQKISAKVNMLLAQMGTAVTTDMADCFNLAEVSITDFVEAVIETDVVSS